jgi:hypothetical protein
MGRWFFLEHPGVEGRMAACCSNEKPQDKEKAFTTKRDFVATPRHQGHKEKRLCWNRGNQGLLVLLGVGAQRRLVFFVVILFYRNELGGLHGAMQWTFSSPFILVSDSFPEIPEDPFFGFITDERGMGRSSV